MGNGVPANAIELLRKAASDGTLAARMEKSAKARLLGGLLGAGVGGATGGWEGAGAGATAGLLGGKKLFTTPRMGARYGLPLGPGARQFSPSRLAATAGVATGLAGANSHLNQNAANTEGMNLNPYTWGRNAVGRRLGMNQGPNKEQIYTANQQGMNDVFDRSGLKGEIEAARASGDTTKLMELMKRKQTGDFDVDHGWSMGKILDGNMPDINPLNYRMGGLNPWAHTSAKTSRGRMDAAQGGLQNEYNAAMQKSGPQPGDAETMQQLQAMMAEADPADAPMLQEEMKKLQARMQSAPGTESPQAAAIKQRMMGAGMRHTPWKPPAAPPGPAPAGPSPQPTSGNWANIGRRPGVQGWASNPYDFRKSDPWEAVIGGPANSPMQFGG